jgi:hypothetical protein
VRVFIEKPKDELEERARAREVRRALDEFGFEYGGNASGESDPHAWFDVTFPGDVPPGAVNQFLASLGARGVSVQRGDGHALAPAGPDARAVDELVTNKLVDTEMIPTDALGETVQQWRDSLWVTPAQMDAAQEQAAYEKIVNEYAPQPDDEVLRPRPQQLSDLEQMRADTDAEYRRMVDAGMDKNWHRDSGF